LKPVEWWDLPLVACAWQGRLELGRKTKYCLDDVPTSKYHLSPFENPKGS
jgi:hypothetical protein